MPPDDKPGCPNLPDAPRNNQPMGATPSQVASPPGPAIGGASPRVGGVAMPISGGFDYRRFIDVFQEESAVINERRIAVAEGKLAEDRHVEPAPGQRPLNAAEKDAISVVVEECREGGAEEVPARADERQHPIARLRPGHNLTGLALSGGGIRSASFCLGVLQGIDALREDTEPQVLDQIDYLSTVSGGGYIGTSMVLGLMQTDGRFPFASKLDQQETVETQHIRDYSNYLFPNGLRDYVAGIIAVSRGLLLNIIVYAGILFLLATGTVLLLPFFAKAGGWIIGLIGLRTGGILGEFGWTATLIGILMACQVAVAIISSRIATKWSLDTRETVSRLLSRLLIVIAAIAAVELIGYSIKSVGKIVGPSTHKVSSTNTMTPRQSTSILEMLTGAKGLLSNQVSIVTFVLAVLVVALVVGTLARKISTVARTTAGDETWKGSLKRWGSWGMLYLSAASVPILLLLLYLVLCYWGFRSGDEAIYDSSGKPTGLPAWLTWSMGRARAWSGVKSTLKDWSATIYPALVAYASLGTVCLGVSLLVRPNLGSLHGFYRDRLSRAFLWNKDKLEAAAQDTGSNGYQQVWGVQRRIRERIRNLGRTLPGKDGTDQRSPTADAPAEEDPFADVDGFKFSRLKARAGNAWSRRVRFAPYLLVNTAVNLEASPYLKRRGRKADSFMFSPLFMGSEATGYVESLTAEGVDTDIDLGTAMAVSGAAASANMGSGTIRSLTFSLSALNVRLGYWTRNPRYVPTWKKTARLWDNVGPVYYALETLGRLSEDTRNVYLTDGGHFDNLGLYELLKRRCRLIIAVDAEADPGMNFDSFIRVQRYARIDLGVRIDVPWEHLRRKALSVGNVGWERPIMPTDCQGPHVAVGYIHYGKNERGVLIYIKASLSGDESDLINDYKRRYRDYPHETTLDQFFSEEQFEVYRGLGFHVTKGFFGGTDDFAMFPADRYTTWIRDLTEVLDYVNIPMEARASIIARAMKGPKRSHRSGAGGKTGPDTRLGSVAR